MSSQERTRNSRDGTLKSFARSICRRIAEAGSHTKARSTYEQKECFEHAYRCMAFLGRNGIEGDVLEFGVANGASLLTLYTAAEELLRRREGMTFRVIGFDSFEGLPAATGVDRDYHGQGSGPGVKFSKGQYEFSLQRVQQKLARKTLGGKPPELVKGWYKETLTEELKRDLGIQNACFIHIDCDFYESTRVALDWCRSLVQEGTIICLDDWFCYKGSSDHGERKAFLEFLADYPELEATEFSQYSWHGKSFIIGFRKSELP